MDDRGLHQRTANAASQSPLAFLKRTAEIYPDQLAVIHGPHTATWGEVDRRARRLAAALSAHGLQPGDCAAILAPNIPAFVEASFGVPLARVVLLSLNTRLDADQLAYCMTHGEAKVLLVDRELVPLAAEAVALMDEKPTVVRIDDPLAAQTDAPTDTDYESFLAAEPMPWPDLPDDWESFSLSYTSGTTGRPKGVVYSHRGVATTAISNALDWAMPHFPRYLWTLPMFHCNGWCFPYTLALTAGVSVCLRQVSPAGIAEAFQNHGVTHLCGAPIVMQMAIEGCSAAGFRADPTIEMMTAAAPPPAAVIAKMTAIGVNVTHAYGLTETYGPCVVSAWNPAWDTLPDDEKARLKARQGVAYSLQGAISVRDPQTMEEVPRTGEVIGEIMVRGNIVMKGYLKDEAATETAFAGGWFHTGDLAVWHPDGYMEIKDRAKDIIISGGENISSIEIEAALYQHPAVAMVAVVAMPHEQWGETPCAFVELVPSAHVEEVALIQWCRERIASYKLPRKIVFEPLPKTSTGKIQKFQLRRRAKEIAGA